ncbi:pyrokinin-1 receptor-like [Mytilus galloprovincialis]|uniref:pyrokinin-1 receptor-like n=1 Tax=Mytilus galloprovincialis TaxID=29158 RepID=UPI003F7CBD5D
MVDRYPFEGNLTRLLRNVSDKFSTTSSDFQNSYNNSPKITENWNSYGNNSTGINVNLVENYTSLNVQDYLGPQRNKFFIVICLTIIYTTIFVTGLMGNLFTCIVILKNFYMRTVTNYYLASLALADLLTLTFALPPEVYNIWESYPWRFGEPFCIFKAFLLESTSYASVLTITGFTIERYIAICHPIVGQRVSRQSRAIKCIIVIWIISGIVALPYPIHTRTFYYLNDPRTSLPLEDTLVCNIPIKWHERMIIMFQVSTFAFFFLPMTVITVMYILIGIRLRNTEIGSSNGFLTSSAKNTTTRARKAVLKMLVAVVVAFFLCWAPFHAQRLMTLYTKNWTPETMELHSHLFYISGVLYFVSSTVNPILYNLLSRKFRYAFKRTFCRCCIDLDKFPTFYKLKAIFRSKNDPGTTTPSGMRYMFPQKPVRMNTVYGPKNCTSSQQRLLPNNNVSTRDSLLKISNGSGSSSDSGSHAHSDGRLHYLCRHKSCSSNKTRPSIEGQMFCKQNNNASCQDIDKLRKLSYVNKNPLTTFNSIAVVADDIRLNSNCF